jgi:hypothetical protein
MNTNTALELKDDNGDDSAAVVTKALSDFQMTVEDRLKAIETKANDNKANDRLDKIEAKMNRPAIIKSDWATRTSVQWRIHDVGLTRRKRRFGSDQLG